MNDFDFDIMQKKSIASGARHQKKGTKSKKCSLPSDRLTNKQWKERCGEVMTYNLNKPMEWNKFKRLPSMIQTEYLSGLQRKFSVSASDLARMFGVTAATVIRHADVNNLGITFPKGRTMTAEKRALWENFQRCGEDTDMFELAVPQNVQETVAQIPDGMSDAGCAGEIMTMSSVSLVFNGKIDVDAIANSLRSILGTNATGSVQIVCNLE